jgi:hypothetical protein
LRKTRRFPISAASNLNASMPVPGMPVMITRQILIGDRVAELAAA